MQETNCPLCFGELEVRDVAPCDECGALPQEIEHFASGKHSYAEYEVFPPLKLTLCNFCDVDFGSGDPTFFDCRATHELGTNTCAWFNLCENRRLVRTSFAQPATCAYPFCGSCIKRGSSMLANKPLVPTRNGEAPMLAAQRRR